MKKVNIPEKLELIMDHWNPRIAGRLNGQLVKLVKLKGEFIWHKHDNEDEMFFVIEGRLGIEFRDKTIFLEKDEFLVIPRGIEHRPVAEEEVSVMLFEPEETINTGDAKSDFTKLNLQSI